MLQGIRRKFRPLDILTDGEVEAIHSATLHVLEHTGIQFESRRAREFLEQEGCQVDFDARRVRFPPALVEECLRRCPSSFRVRARHSDSDFRIGGTTLHFEASVGFRKLNLDTWEPETATLKDHRDAIRLNDALESVHCQEGWEFYMDMKDIPGCMMMLEGLASGYRNSAKAENFGHMYGCEVFAIEMAQALGTDLTGCVSASPPLTQYEDTTNAIFGFCESGNPIGFNTGVILGGTGPATIAGSTVTNNADLMAGIILAQLIRPGTRVVATDFAFPMNMRTGSPDFSTVTTALHQLAFSQIWRRYGIPVAGSAAASFASSKMIDFQNAAGRVRAVLLAVLAGNHFITLHGGVYGEYTYSPAMAVLDEDLCQWIKRLLEGVEVSEDTLALDLIDEVGPIPGSYLGAEHTREWWKREGFVPRCDDRNGYDEWIEMGKPTALENARRIAKELISTHKPIPLTEGQEEDVARILNDAREYYRKKGMISDQEMATYMTAVGELG